LVFSSAFSLKRKLQRELSLHRCPEVHDIQLPKCLDHETGLTQAKHFSPQLLPDSSADATRELVLGPAFSGAAMLQLR
jgi:hypothetical protein